MGVDQPAGRAPPRRGACARRLCGRRDARAGSRADAGHRAVPRRVDARAGGSLGWAAGLWLFTELCRLAVGAAAAAAVPVIRVGLTTTAEFATATSAGRSGLFSIAAAGLVLVATFAVPKTPPAAVAAAGIAAVGLVARTVGGHMSASVPGAIAIAVHVLGRRRVVRDVGGARLDGRPSWPVGAGAAAILRDVVVVCDRIAGRRRDRCSRGGGFGVAVVRYRLRPCFAGQDRPHRCLDGVGLA